MTYLIDTNVISELRKGGRCDPNVTRWFQSTPDASLYVSVLVFGEIRKGIERIRPRDPAQARALEGWLSTLRTTFAERVLPVDAPTADEWGRIAAIRPLQPTDALLAATAKVHSMTLVSRNVFDVTNLGVKLLNPFVA